MPLFLCLDLQRAFVEPGALRAPKAGDALLHGRRLLSLMRQKQWAVAHCFLKRDAAPIDRSGVAARPVEGFEPLVNESVFERATLSAYGHEGFAALMEEWAPAGVIVAGLSASLTFLATAIDAFERGHRLVIAADALAGQAGREADASAHEAVGRDVAALLGHAIRTQVATLGARARLNSAG